MASNHGIVCARSARSEFAPKYVEGIRGFRQARIEAMATNGFDFIFISLIDVLSYVIVVKSSRDSAALGAVSQPEAALAL